MIEDMSWKIGDLFFTEIVMMLAFPGSVTPAESQKSFVLIQVVESDFLRCLKYLKPELHLEGMYLWERGD